jgi:hypothetical protein
MKGKKTDPKGFLRPAQFIRPNHVLSPLQCLSTNGTGRIDIFYDLMIFAKLYFYATTPIHVYFFLTFLPRMDGRNFGLYGFAFLYG